MWNSDDEYCDRIWQRWERAKKIIEQYKDSPVEDIAFLCEYCKMEMEDNEELEDKNTKLWKHNNHLKCDMDNYMYLSQELEKRLKTFCKSEYKELMERTINRLKEKYIQNISKGDENIN